MLTLVQLHYRSNWLKIIIQKKSTASLAFGGKIRIRTFYLQELFLPVTQKIF